MGMQKTKSGFTIVELLVAIAVIATLAAISFVSYGGIQKRTQNSAALAKARQAGEAVMTHYASKATFPDVLEDVDVPSEDIQYTVDNSVTPPTFCLTATEDTSSFYINESLDVPAEGRCAEHSE